MLTLNRILAFSGSAFVVLCVLALASGDERTVDRFAPWAARALLLFGIAGLIWLWRRFVSHPARKVSATPKPPAEPSVDVWHATIWARNQEHHEDRVGREAAQAWVAEKLTELGYANEVTWQSAQDVCTATLPPDAAATVRRRKS